MSASRFALFPITFAGISHKPTLKASCSVRTVNSFLVPFPIKFLSMFPMGIRIENCSSFGDSNFHSANAIVWMCDISPCAEVESQVTR